MKQTDEISFIEEILCTVMKYYGHSDVQGQYSKVAPP